MRREKLRQQLVQLPSEMKLAIIAASDTVLVISLLAATLLLSQPSHPVLGRASWVLFLLTAALAVPVLASQGLYRAIIRFIGAEMLVAVIRGVTLVALSVGVGTYFLHGSSLRAATTTTAVFWTFTVLALYGSRLLMQAALSNSYNACERVAIYGAGIAGLRLVVAAARSREFRPIFFVDDDVSIQGRVVAGLPVAAPGDLPRLITKHGIGRILLALPSVSWRRRQQLIGSLSSLPVQLQTVPDIGDLMTGRARVDEVRDVGAKDILGRQPVAPNAKLLDACIRNKCVMVTGAGGSIGSELCRQIIELGPRQLVLFELSELALYNIEQELQKQRSERGLSVTLVPLLGSVHHRERLRHVMSALGVQTVYHAAAYKHVPIVEYNMVEGIHNNVIGTWYAAEAAEEAGVETFVLISTDKAVSPVNVMGATKRLAELVLQGMAQRSVKTRFCMVRFGNVLDSSGSVVPLFREQIRRGGPVTVTHAEVTRYFMTIPEAAQLVIQAGSMGKGGDVFVLNMGDPVRIADLARRMIELMGLSVQEPAHPGGDILIEYVGLRPGERLYEDLLVNKNAAGTEHPMILRAFEEAVPWQRVRHYLDQLLAATNLFDCNRARQLLLESVNGFEPACEDIQDLIWRAVPHAAPRPVSVVQLRSS